MMEYQHVNVPFKGESTYKDHFVGYKVDIPQSQYLSGPVVNGSPTRFEGKTAYQ